MCLISSGGGVGGDGEEMGGVACSVCDVVCIELWAGMHPISQVCFFESDSSLH